MTSYATVVQADNPRNYWRLNGDGIDAQGTGNNFVWAGTEITSPYAAIYGDADGAWRGSESGGAPGGTGGGDGFYKTLTGCSPGNLPNPCTIEQWYNPTYFEGAGPNPSFLWHPQTGGHWWAVTGDANTYLDAYDNTNAGGQLIWTFPNQGGGTWQAAAHFTWGLNYRGAAWAHVVWVFDVASWSCTVNNVLVASGAYPVGVTGVNPVVGQLEIGNQADLGVDDMALYPAALSAARISAHYQAAMQIRTGVYVGGNPVNSIAGTLNLQQQIGQRGTGSVSVWTAPGVFWQYGTQVQVYDLGGSGTLIYSGYVRSDEIRKGSRQGTGYLEHALTLMDNAYRSDKRLITMGQPSQSAGANVNVIAGVLAAEGVTTTATSVAAGPTLPPISWLVKPISEGLDWLASQAGYWWSIDANGVLWFQPYGGLAASGTIDGSDIDTDTAVVKYGNEMYVNGVYVEGGTDATGTLTETFSGDGHRRAFTLAHQLASLTSITLNGVSQTFGTKAITTGKQWYYAVGNEAIGQDPGGTVLTSSDTLTVVYKGRYPVLGYATNAALVAAQAAREGGGTGRVETVHHESQIYTLAGAVQIAAGILAKYGADLVSLEYDARGNTIQVGQSVVVNLADFAINNHTMLCTALTISDSRDGMTIWYHPTLVGSPYNAAQPHEYYRRLQQQRPDAAIYANVGIASTNAGQVTTTANWNWTAQVTTGTVHGFAAMAANAAIGASARIVTRATLQANAVLQGP